MAAAVPSKDTPVVMYCNRIKRGRAAKAVQAAIDLGYAKVYYFALGMGDWKEKGLPLISGSFKPLSWQNAIEQRLPWDGAAFFGVH